MKKTVMLKKNYEFHRIFINGKCYKGKYIEIFILKSKNNKLGIAISKKSGNSVFRNRIKRLIRENYRALEEKIKDDFTIVVLLRRNVVKSDTTFFNIKNDMLDIFERANIV